MIRIFYFLIVMNVKFFWQVTSCGLEGKVVLLISKDHRAFTIRMTTKTLQSVETSVDIYHSTQPDDTGDLNLQQNRCHKL